MATEVLFLHGYYGSHLKDGSGRRRFLNFSHLVPLKSAPSLSDWPNLKPEIVKTAGFGPIQRSVYAKPFQLLRESTKTQIRDFSYDWRKDIKESALQLLDRLEQSTAPQWIFTHSMGGLVALSALIQAHKKNRGKALSQIKGITFVVAPFQGLPVLFRNFVMGTPFYYNPYYLMPATLLTYVSPYQMLPDRVKLFTPNGFEWLDTSDEKSWTPHLKQFSSAALGSHEFAQKIKEAALFRDHLRLASKLDLDFPIEVIQAHGRETPAAYEILDNGQLKLDHYHFGPFMMPRKDFHSEDGDRTVLLSSQFLPDELQKKARVRTYQAGHLDILEHPKMLEDFGKSLHNIEI
jgi:hypothetical protein